MTLDSAACGLEGLIKLSAGCSFPVSQRFCKGLRFLAGWLETFNFSRVQKVTLGSAACGLEGPKNRSAGCCFPVSERFSKGLWFLA